MAWLSHANAWREQIRGVFTMTISRRDFVAALVCSGAAYAAADTGGGTAGGASEKAVYVVAEVEVNPGKRDEFIAIFKANVPAVLAEDGCVFYDPVVDIETGIGAQGALRENVMTVVEKWDTLDALRAHLVAPHMGTYREQVKDLVAGVTLRVMQPA
jgi:quinol monooxygenase YgiN